MDRKIPISNNVTLDEGELEMKAIRAQGAGGQNVNKVSSAIHLRFDIRQSSLPDFYKQRLLALKDHRISHDGVIIIKSQQSRSQEKNRQDAIARLVGLIKSAIVSRKKRIPTRKPRAADLKRRQLKAKRGQLKASRKKLQLDE